MAARYHVNASGVVGACTAQEGNCPFGADAPHFTNPDEARAAYEAFMGAATVAPAAKKIRTYLTDLPEPEYELMEMMVPATAIRPGDRVFYRGTSYPVQATRVGYKYNAVTVEGTKGARTINVPLTDRATVEREVETQTSVAERNHAMTDRRFQAAADNYRPRAAVAFNELQDLIMSGSSPIGAHLDTLTHAQATDTVMREYREEVERLKKSSFSLPYLSATGNLSRRYEGELMDAMQRVSEPMGLDERALMAAKASFVQVGPDFLQ